MSLIKNGQITEDSWQVIAEDGLLPSAGDIIVTLEFWQASRDRLLRHNGRLGLRLRSDEAAGAIVGDLEHLDLVALEFPKFNDGRAYSTARLLRERYGFAGEVRAVGNVLRDQLHFMRRCGFDAFEVVGDKALQDWCAALAEISVTYQPDALSAAPRWRSGPPEYRQAC